MRTRRDWVGEAGVIAGLAALVAAKMWTLITPLSQFRASLGGDFGLAVEPYFYHMLKRGTIPLWDPTLATGSPFIGGGTHHPMYLQAHLHLFYPLNLLWLGIAERHQFIAHAVLQYHHAFHYLLAGVFAYLYGRQLRLPRFPSSVSAIAFMFSGFLLSHVQHWTIIDTIAWLPLILTCLVRADITERPRWGALAGLCLGVAFLAGHPQIFYYVGLATVALGVTLLGRRVAAGRPWRRLAAALLLIPLVALGISAVQLLPSWEVAVGSQRAGLDYGWKSVGSLHPGFLFQLFLPWGLLPVGSWRGSVSEFYVYPGLLPLVFAGYAVARRWDWRVGFHAALGLGALLLAFGDTYQLYRLAFEVFPGFALFRIPARILALLSFALAVLAGLGADAFLTDSRPHGLRRFLRWSLVVAAAGGIPVYLLLIWSQGGPHADTYQGLADQYMLLLLILLVILATVAWHARGRSLTLVRGGVLLALLVDLAFGSFALGSAAPNPDVRPAHERQWIERLAEDGQPFRMSRDSHLHPRPIYRHGWGVFDGENTFSPVAFLDLYVLREANPQLLDLLNVKYFVGIDPPPAVRARTTGPLRLRPGARRRVPFAQPTAVRTLEIESHLVHGLDVPQGETVATVHAVGEDGSVRQLLVRAGVETAEWALDRPRSRAAHGKPPVARSWAVAAEGFDGHAYRATLALSGAPRVTHLVFERAAGDAILVMEHIRVNGEDLTGLPERFHLVGPRLYENRYALPRAFLLRHARPVPRDRILDEIRDFDPAQEILLSEPLPQGWPSDAGPAGPPLPPVRFLEYSPHRIRLETTVMEPVFLLLSDTYHPGWRAWDNGQPVPILRADHALRAVALAPGPHEIEFRYRQRSLWIGLGISLATWASLALTAIALLTRTRRSPR